MKKQKIILAIIILVLIIGNIYFGFSYFKTKKELQAVKQSLEVQGTNEKVLKFTQLFITEVLKAEGEINFETRLQLENAVRDIGDEEIKAQWDKFVETKTETEAQTEVKNLLELLVSKIK